MKHCFITKLDARNYDANYMIIADLFPRFLDFQWKPESCCNRDNLPKADTKLKSCEILFHPVDQSLWNWVQSTAVILPCPVEILKWLNKWIKFIDKWDQARTVARVYGSFLDQFPVLKMPWFVLDVQLQDLTWTIMLIRWTLPPVAPYTNMV